MTDVSTPPASPDLPSQEAERDIRDLAGGALVTFLGKLGRVSRGAFIWVITLFCGIDVQGMYTTVWGLVSSLNKIGRFGMHRGVVRYVVEARTAGDRIGEERALGTAMVIATMASLLVAGATMAWADWIDALISSTRMVPLDQSTARAIRIMAPSAPFMALTWIFVCATRALRIMRYDVYVISIAGPLMLLFGGVVIGLLGWGLEAIAWVQLLMAVGSCLLARYYFGHFFSLAGSLRSLRHGLTWRPMSRFCVPVMLADLLYSLLTQIDVLMLPFFVSWNQVGLYAIARRIASSMLKAGQAFDPMFSSIVSELSFRQRHDDLSHRFVVISRWILTINLPLLACLLILGDQILTLSAGEKFMKLSPEEIEGGFHILYMLCAGMMIQGIFAIGQPLLTMAGRPHVNTFNNLIWLAANVGLNLLLIPTYGFVGAAAGAVIAMLLANGIRMAQVYVYHRIQPFQRTQLKPLIAAASAALICWGAQEQLATADGLVSLLRGTVISCLIFLASYFVVLRLQGFEAEDRAMFAMLQRRIGRFRKVSAGDESSL